MAESQGYDHTFVLNAPFLAIPSAVLFHNISGRQLEVFTTEPGIQLYTGNFLDGSLIISEGNAICKNAGLCLETQHFFDSPNQSSFPFVI